MTLKEQIARLIREQAAIEITQDSVMRFGAFLSNGDELADQVLRLIALAREGAGDQ